MRIEKQFSRISRGTLAGCPERLFKEDFPASQRSYSSHGEFCNQHELLDLLPKRALAHLIDMSIEKATFGAGCFWGVEAAFAAIPGVTATAVGYEGGKLHQPSYKDVCTASTGHAEVVELDFDPARVSFEQLLDAFFTLHDPTTLNRQGPDWGEQYRSAIFFHSPEQEAQARAKIEQLSVGGHFKPKRIVTKVEPAQTFWRAEEYHQRYLEKRGQASCHI
jgi:peptide-methionine (S)-S-oxide reductase